MTAEIPEKDYSNDFVFVQMNFWEGRLFYPIDKFLKRENPDILSGQEMLSGPSDLSPSFMTTESLVGKEYFGSCILGGTAPIMSRDNYDFVTMCATLIKPDIVCEFKNTISLPMHHNNLREGKKDWGPYHDLLHSRLRFADGTFVNVLTHHGRLVVGDKGRLGSKMLDDDFKRIADYIATLTGPLIFSGDFNLFKEASSLQPLRDLGLVNLNDVHNISIARNEFAWKKDESVSHIFINDAVNVKEYRIPTDNVSDHLPLVMRCSVKRS